MADDDYDFIVVGAGPGGGPLAARLALEGYRVALFDAGGDPAKKPDDSDNPNYCVPAFYAEATRDNNFRWDFFVQHYTADERGRRDPKYVPGKRGILYPRASGLGGCAAHNALITINPHDTDWDKLAQVTGDADWSKGVMRPYFEKIQVRHYPSLQAGQLDDLKRWLHTDVANGEIIFRDRQLLRIFVTAAVRALLEQYRKARGECVTDSSVTRSDVEGFIGRIEGYLNTVAGRLLLTNVPFLADLQAWRRRFRAAFDRNEPALIERVTRDMTEAFLDAIAAHESLRDFLYGFHRSLDPNLASGAAVALPQPFAVPMAIRDVRRISPRDRIRQVEKLRPGRLILKLNCLVTRVVFDNDRKAIGVKYVERPKLYEAAPGPHPGAPLPADRDQAAAYVRRDGEIILAGGAFNTPQLLMLSGIGDTAHLRATAAAAHDENLCALRGRDGMPLLGEDRRPLRVSLPGVGKNLQDRYEVTLVYESADEFQIIPRARRGNDLKTPAGPLYEQWQRQDAACGRVAPEDRNVYATNGVLLTVIERSSQQAATDPPDLFLFGLPGRFTGYHPNWPDDILTDKDGTDNRRQFTWAILKGRTKNSAGTVRLQSADPRKMPIINFRYFDEGGGEFRKDLDALVEAVGLARRLMAPSQPPDHEVHPKLGGRSPRTPEEIRNVIMQEAWGHHACGTCKMGRSTANLRPPNVDADSDAVVDSKLRVYGVHNLRVVDASVFPDIPGFFIVTSIYMVSERAADIILKDWHDAGRRPTGT